MKNKLNPLGKSIVKALLTLQDYYSGKVPNLPDGCPLCRAISEKGKLGRNIIRCSVCPWRLFDGGGKDNCVDLYHKLPEILTKNLILTDTRHTRQAWWCQVRCLQIQRWLDYIRYSDKCPEVYLSK